jgi:hypothetical protein
MQWSFILNNFGVCPSASNPGYGVLEVVLSLSHQRGRKTEENKTKQCKTKQNNPTKCPKFKCNTVSVSFSARRYSSVVFSSKIMREKKKSLETVLWMAICGCGSSAHYCQPAIAGGFIYADLRSELNTHLAPQALFTQSSVHDATATSFPLSKHTGGGDTAPVFSGLCVHLQLTWEVGLPPLLWSFPPSATLTSFPAPGCWVHTPTPALSGQARLVYLQFREGLLSPPSSALRAPHPLCYMSLLCLLLITQFLFFPWVAVSLSSGLCLSGPGMIVRVPCTT